MPLFVAGDAGERTSHQGFGGTFSAREKQCGGGALPEATVEPRLAGEIEQRAITTRLAFRQTGRAYFATEVSTREGETVSRVAGFVASRIASAQDQRSRSVQHREFSSQTFERGYRGEFLQPVVNVVQGQALAVVAAQLAAESNRRASAEPGFAGPRATLLVTQRAPRRDPQPILRVKIETHAQPDSEHPLRIHVAPNAGADHPLQHQT
jgi:hypothetical protein